MKFNIKRREDVLETLISLPKIETLRHLRIKNETARRTKPLKNETARLVKFD